LEECWPCPVFVNYTLAFALQLREKHGKPSVRVAKEVQSIRKYKRDRKIFLKMCGRHLKECIGK
jgi:hypothetical protein